MKKINTKLLFWFGGITIYLIILKLIVISESSVKDSNIKNYFDALWYSLVTFSTVGYGDRFPITVVGKLLAIILLIASFGILGYLVGLVSNKINKYMENKKLGFFGTDFKNHIVVVGWNSFSRQVIDQIVKAHKQVAIITNDKNQVDLIYELFPEKLVFVLFSDYAHYENFKKVNIEDSSAVFINLANDTDTLVYLLNIKKLYTTQNYVVSLDNQSLKETFLAAGVTYCISKDEIASKLVASYIFEPSVAILVEDLMATTISKNDYDIKEYCVTQKNPYLKYEYFDTFVDLKATHNCVLLGLSKKINNKRVVQKNPPKDTIIELNDSLIIMMDGHAHEVIDKLFDIQEG